MTKYVPKIAEYMNADGSVPNEIQQKVTKINQQLHEWGERGSVKRSYAQSWLSQQKLELSEMAERHNQAQISQYENAKNRARESFYEKVEAHPYAHLVRRERAQFEAGLLTDDEVNAQLAYVSPSSEVHEIVDRFDSYTLEALLNEAKRRGLDMFRLASETMKKHDLSLDMFERSEIVSLRQLAEQHRKLPKGAILVSPKRQGHEGETMAVRLDQVIDDTPLDNLADPGRTA